MRSNKTILGNSGATISGFGLNVSGDRNVIIRNINFTGWGDDAINVQESATILQPRQDHAAGPQRRQRRPGRGHLRVSYHHNWFDGTNQRHPRVRFGNPVHVYNNFYGGEGDSGPGSGGSVASIPHSYSLDTPLERQVRRDRRGRGWTRHRLTTMQDQHNFREVVASADPRGHNFPEVVTILGRPAGQEPQSPRA